MTTSFAMSPEKRLIKQGAEAKLYACSYLGRPTIVKERFQKNYRHPDLDTALTKERIKNEARAIARCKTAGVRTPALYLVDFNRRCIFMEYFERAVTVKKLIIDVMIEMDDEDKRNVLLEKIAKAIGATVRKMHESNIIHGDLTTSNMLLLAEDETENSDHHQWNNYDQFELVMIDFGLARVESSAEDKGVDLYVLERALISTHNDLPNLFTSILNSYKGFSKGNVKEIVDKFEEVRARGRKRTMVG